MRAVKRDSTPTVLITGGAGFIGTNMARHLLENGERVRIFDSYARPGSEQNASWLREHYPRDLEIVEADVRDRNALRNAIADVDHVYHFAAQVAVTSSLVDPQHDFEVNARGTLNLLESARECATPPSILFSSTNKVYGILPDVHVECEGKRYLPVDRDLRARGVSESRSLDFHSPYGCSKGCAEQYVLDYARSFGLRTAVFRMSCIYGPHQHGNEDQGWVAHFMRKAMAAEPVTIYGDGLQVRDALFVEDLVAAFETARHDIERLQGEAFNIGGGVANTLSILELMDRLEQQLEESVSASFGEWRTGDQRYYVSDISKFRSATGWRPKVGIDEGLNALHRWLENSRAPVNSPAARPGQRLTAGA
ncbi:MAG: SDR family NAD(P)-dependent oxidoreductase [Povalibacter sp.]